MCLAEAGCRFSQASHMPFLQPPLIKLFTKQNVYMTTFEQVQQGKFICPPGTDPMAAQLLKALARPPNIPKIQVWSLDKVTAGCQQAREATSSSPSGLHFGHYMAGTFNPMIAVFNARLANLGFTTGHSLK